MSPLWRLVRRLFGKPKGRHAMGVAPGPAPVPLVEREPQPLRVPAAELTPVTVVAAPELTPVTEAAAPELTPVIAAPPAPTPVIAAPPAPTPVEPVPDLGPVRLIFSDGTSAALPAGSPEEHRARYLAQNMLEATARV